MSLLASIDALFSCAMLAEVPDPSASGIPAIEACYESGRYWSAYRMAHASGLFDVTRATPVPDAVLAGRILRATGAPRRARKLLLEAWRRDRADARACVFAAYEQLQSGPLAALVWMERIGNLDGASAELRSDWWTARALAHAELRDFSIAERSWQTARELHEDAWTWCARAWLDDARDRLDAALTAIDRAREHSRWYRPALESSCRMLVRSRRSAEARALLVEATDHGEAASTQLILAALHRDAGDHDGSVAALHRAVKFAPAMERELHDQIAWEFGFSHYLRGDAELGVQLMRLVDHERVRATAQRIATTPGTRRKLPVPHVPQHHNTCAPATLTAIAEMWGETVDHVDIAEKICHDGTPAGSERRWAEERGFIARQFTVTWDAARRLIDAGIPFALTTSFTIGAHLQPVAGYDERRRSLVVPDPSASWCIDLEWDRLATAQAPFGPRGMAFVPASRRAALDAIELPDAGLYDAHHALEAALQKHDRSAARAAFERLVAHAPADHYLLHQAQRALACYDGDERGTLQWIEALRRRFPDDVWLRTCELASLHGHASEERRAELAAGLLGKHNDDPGVVVTCARFLLGVGEIARARSLATRAIKSARQHGGAYHLAADAAWGMGERTLATRLYRIASCLADRDESAAWSYFVAALITGRVDEALAYLADRVERMQTRSGAPARTLCEAFHVVGRSAEGQRILDAAVAAHPDDGTLLLVAAEQHRLARDLDRAQQYIDRARGKIADAPWRRAAAVLAVQRGDVARALALRRELVADDPLDIESQAAYVALLERAGSWDEARAHVLATCERFPFHILFARLCDEVLRVRDPETARTRLVAFLDRQPVRGCSAT
jgi:tetratricopeptide (TPR) repeat protein